MTSEERVRGVVLYHTLGCHLCELAFELAAPVATVRGWTLEQCEIADSEELMQRYGIRIPVLRDPATDRELGWPFDERDVAGFLS